MNPNRYFIPNMGMHLQPNMNYMMMPNYFTPNRNIFGRITDSVKRFNWNGLLFGANKTLSVVNQTIPLIQRTKPMISNLRNMLQLAKAFKMETGKTDTTDTAIVKEKEVMANDNQPNFFI